MKRETGPGWDLRLGAWQDVLSDVECDALICDPPYSARTHEGAMVIDKGGGTHTEINYAHYDRVDVEDLIGSWSRRVRGWIVVMHDHAQQQWYADALEASGRYVFAPLPYVNVAPAPRMTGDGPASSTCWITVARPRSQEWTSWGSLPGHYVGVGGRHGHQHVVGGKPEWLMRAIVRDYSRPGDLVVDPFCGGGTTALAAAMEGRRAITSEIDPEHFGIARRRLSRGVQGSLI